MKMKNLIGVSSKAVVLGAIAVFILVIIRIVAVAVLESLHEFWSSSFVLFGATGTTATFLEYVEALLYTTALVGVVGLLLLFKGRGNGQSIGDKTLSRVPVVKTLWALFHNISKLVHHITERPFVLVLGWPAEGHSTVGVVTKKQVFSKGRAGAFSRPTVYISTPPNPTSGFIIFPERDRIILLTSPASQIMQLIISIGMLGPDNIDLAPDSDQSLLDDYYE